MAETPVRGDGEVPEGLDLLGPGDHACLIQEPGADPLPTIVAFLRCDSKGDSQAVAALAPETSARLHEMWPGRGLQSVDAPASADEIAALGSELSSPPPPPAQRRAVVDMNFVAARNLREILRGEAALQGLVDDGEISLLCVYERRPERADLLLEVVRMHPVVISSGLVGRNDACMPAAELLEAWDPASELDEVLSAVHRRPLTGEEPAADTSERPPGEFEVIVRDADLTIAYVNEALAGRLGVRREDLIGETDFQLWSEPVARRRRSAARRVIRSAEPEVQTEQSLDARTGAGTLRVVRSPILDEQGEPRGMIEARGTSEAGLPKSPRPAQRATGRLELAPGGTVVEWGREAAGLYLYGAEEILGRHYTHLLPPHARAAGRELLAEAATGKTARAERLLHVTRYGDTLALDVRVSPLTTEEGMVFALEVRFETVEQRPDVRPKGAETADRQPLSELVPDFTYVYDMEAEGFGYLSPWTAMALGIAEEELTAGEGPAFVGRAHPDDAASVAEAQAQLEAGKTRQCTLEYRVAGDRGRYVTVRERRTAVAADGDGPTSFAGEVWIRDDEGNRRASFADALTHIPDAEEHACRLLLKDADLTYAWSDGGWAANVGLEPAELIGKTDADLYPEGLAQTFRKDDRHFLDNENGPGISIGSAFRDHKGRVWERHKVRLTGPDGGVQGLLVANVDVTNRRPEALLPHWAAVIEATEDAVMALTSDGTVVSWNPGAEKTFGYSSREARGCSFLSMVAPRFQEELKGILGRVRDGRSVTNHQTTQITREGRQIETDLTLSPIFSTEGEVDGVSVIARDVTAYRQMERSLVQSRQSFQSVLESVRDVVYQIDLNSWEFSYVSPSVEGLLGYTAAEVMEMGPTEVFKRVSADDSERLARLTKYLLEDQRRPRREPRVEYRLQTAEGRLVWVSDNRQLIRDESGQPTAIVGALRDITGRKEAEAELEGFPSEPPSQLSRAPTRILHKDRQLRFIWVNQTQAEIMGTTPEGAVGKTDFDFWPPELAERFQAEDREVLQSGEAQTYTLTDEYGDGRRRRLEVRKVPTVDANGQVTGLLVIATDVTAQRAAAARLAQWNSVVNSSEDAIIGLSCNGTVLNCNPGAEDIFGRGAGEILGVPVTELVDPEAREDLERNIARAAEGHTVRDLEVPFRKWGNELVYVALSISPITGPDGGVMAISATGRDITARKNAENALRESATHIRPLFSSLIDKVWIKDSDLAYLYAHKEYTDWLGIEQDEIVGKTDFDFYEPEPARRYQAEDREVLEGREPVVVESEERNDALDDVSLRRLLKIPLYGEDGEPAGLVGIWSWPELHQQLGEVLCHWASLIASSDDAVIGLALDGTILSWNPGAERLYGYPASEAVERALGFLAPSHESTEMDEALSRAAQGQSVRNLETTHRTAGGEDIQVSMTLSPIVGPEGEVNGISAIARDITARKRAETELRETEKRFRTVLETIRDVAYKYDLMTEEYDYISPSAKEVFGFTAAELAAGGAEGYFARLHPEDFRKVRASTSHLVITGTEPHLEYRYRHKDGHYVWIGDSRRILRNEEGHAVSIVGLARDITPRKQAEEALRKTAGDVQELLDRLPERVFIKDRNLRFIYVNRAAAEAHGMEPEDIVGKTDHFLYPDDPETAERCREEDRAVIEDGEPRSYVEPIPGDQAAVSGGARRFDKIPVKDAEGQVVAVVGIQNWQADRRTMRDLLAHWASIVRASDDAIIGMTVEGEVLSWNRGAEKVTGYTADEIRGQSVELLVPPDRLENHRDMLARARSGGSVVNQEARVVCKDDTERIVSFTLSPIVSRDGQVQALSFIGRDITERKRLETRMRQAQKLESLGILAGGVAHDFNNLLTGVLGNASLALMDLPEDSPAVYSVEKIQESARHAAELAAQMLAYSGKGQLSLEPIHLSRLVEEMKGLIEAAAGPLVTVELDLEPDLPTLLGDPAQIKQTILNLVTNASEAIGDAEGIIRVEARAACPDADFFTRAYLQGQTDAENYALLRFSDTGCGMDAETAEQVFDPFFSTKFTGRGLGLAALLGIVRGHNGSVRVESNPGEGSTFEILFPADGQETDERPPSKPKHTGAPSRTIMIVDDQDSVREVAGQMLEKIGYETLCVPNGKEAVQLLAEHGDRVAAVLLDMTMPGMEGPEALERLRQVQPGVPVLVASGYNESEIGDRFGQQKPDGFLKKPFTPERLREALSGLLAHPDGED